MMIIVMIIISSSPPQIQPSIMINIIVIMIRRFDNFDDNHRVENMHILLMHSDITIVMVC